MMITFAVTFFFFTESVCALNAPFVKHRSSTSFVFKSSQLSKPMFPLWGILDEINSGAFDLSSNSVTDSPSAGSNLSDAYDVMLAELVFSTNDPRLDIIERFDLVTDPDFLDWMERRIQSSKDPEERLALKDLLDIINDVKRKVEVSRLAEERATKAAEVADGQRVAELDTQVEEGHALSTADILKKATMIQTQNSEEELNANSDKKKSFYEAELTPEIRLSYQDLLRKVLPPYKGGDSAASVAFNFYDQFDAQFVKVLSERVDSGDLGSKALLEALAIEQQKRISTATETLKSVLTLVDPRRMEGAIVRLAREGKIDEAFLLLIEANMNQAQDAGAIAASQIMERLRKRAIDEKDKQTQSKEIRLLRKLLRTDDASEREKLLEDAFTPREVLLVPGTMENAQKAVDGERPDQAKPLPDVPPPDFINACKAVLLNFGNLGSDDSERGDLASRIKKLASEAEVVATRIYGKGMTLREQQDRMWSEKTTSIFDLERMEIDAERRGEQAPWANPNADDDMLLPGFDSKGRMQVGGS